MEKSQPRGWMWRGRHLCVQSEIWNLVFSNLHHGRIRGVKKFGTSKVSEFRWIQKPTWMWLSCLGQWGSSGGGISSTFSSAHSVFLNHVEMWGQRTIARGCLNTVGHCASSLAWTHYMTRSTTLQAVRPKHPPSRCQVQGGHHQSIAM